MLERIVLAVDGSPQSQAAVKVAAELATKCGSEIRVFHAREHEVGRGGAFERESGPEATKLADDAVAELQKAGVKASGQVERVVMGYAAKAILDAATAFEANIIVMGSRGLSDLHGLLVGSVTHKVIHLAHIPVLVVR